MGDSPETLYLQKMDVKLDELPETIQYEIRVNLGSPPKGTVVEEIEQVNLTLLGSIGKSHALR